jgi:hypothetical protein
VYYSPAQISLTHEQSQVAGPFDKVKNLCRISGESP